MHLTVFGRWNFNKNKLSGTINKKSPSVSERAFCNQKGCLSLDHAQRSHVAVLAYNDVVHA